MKTYSLVPQFSVLIDFKFYIVVDILFWMFSVHHFSDVTELVVFSIKNSDYFIVY